MKILLITPIYHIEGRNELFHDSSAIHYLMKPLSDENEIFVLDTYCASIKEYRRFFSINYLKSFFSTYKYKKDGIDVELCEFQFGYKQAFFNKIQAKRLRKRILTKINNINPDIICVHFPTSYFQVIDKNMTNIPIISVMHQTDIVRLKNSKYTKKLVDYLNENYNNIYARSKSIYKKAKLNNIKINKQLVFSGIEKIDKYNIKYRKKINTLLYVGKLIKRKNINLIIDALIEIRNNDRNNQMTLKIIGNGKEKNKLKEKALKHNYIEFFEPMPREKIIEQMSENDIFIMPSINETLGLVYLEAMSTGCVTIGTIGEGIDGVIEDSKNGFLIEPSKEAIIKCIKNITEMPEEKIQDISLNAINTAQKNDNIIASQNYLEIIKKNILQGRNKNV